jgi:hypothetical protein
MNKYTNLILACSLSAISFFISSQAFAVGDGLEFEVDEAQIEGAEVNTVKANSVDLTYHACTQEPINQQIKELGYFWISSYQDENSVVDSQINYFDTNGYHIYGGYTYKSVRVGPAQPSVSGTRLNYQVINQDAGILLYLDPLQDTQLTIQNCQIVIQNNEDDLILGFSNTVIQGEKSETDGLANGDFKVVFSDWDWVDFGEELLLGVNGLSLDDFKFLVFNGNITDLGGPLTDNHNPEGSGNIFWLTDFIPVNGGD